MASVYESIGTNDVVAKVMGAQAMASKNLTSQGSGVDRQMLEKLDKVVQNTEALSQIRDLKEDREKLFDSATPELNARESLELEKRETERLIESMRILSEELRAKGKNVTTEDLLKTPMFKRIQADPTKENIEKEQTKFLKEIAGNTSQRSQQDAQGGLQGMMRMVQAAVSGSALFTSMHSGSILGTAGAAVSSLNAIMSAFERKDKKGKTASEQVGSQSDEGVDKAAIGTKIGALFGPAGMAIGRLVGMAASYALTAIDELARRTISELPKNLEAGRVLDSTLAGRGLGRTHLDRSEALFGGLYDTGNLFLSDDQRNTALAQTGIANLRSPEALVRLVNEINKNIGAFGPQFEKVNQSMVEFLKYSRTDTLPDAFTQALNNSPVAHAAENQHALISTMKDVIRLNPAMSGREQEHNILAMANLQNRLGMYGEAGNIRQATQSVFSSALQDHTKTAFLQSLLGISLDEAYGMSLDGTGLEDHHLDSIYEFFRGMGGPNNVVRARMKNALGDIGTMAWRAQHPPEESLLVGDRGELIESQRDANASFETNIRQNALQFRLHTQTLTEAAAAVAAFSQGIRGANINMQNTITRAGGRGTPNIQNTPQTSTTAVRI